MGAAEGAGGILADFSEDVNPAIGTFWRLICCPTEIGAQVIPGRGVVRGFIVFKCPLVFGGGNQSQIIDAGV